MKKVLSALLALSFSVLFLSPASAAPVVTYDGTGVAKGSSVRITCAPYDSSNVTVRVQGLPLSGTWEYASSGTVYYSYSGKVQCTGRVYSKVGKLVGYTNPIHTIIFV